MKDIICTLFTYFVIWGIEYWIVDITLQHLAHLKVYRWPGPWAWVKILPFIVATVGIILLIIILQLRKV
jgi:hypothetical protein